MNKPRVMARLDVKGPNVVKGVRFEGLRIMGSPDELANDYYTQGADELLYIDTVASLYGRNNLTDIVKQAASNIFIPMIVGGGIRSLDDAKKILRCGADKIAVNTAAVKRPALLKEIATSIGSQALVSSLEVKKRDENRWELFIDNGRESTGIDALDFAKRAENMGAGELLITSVDRDGTGLGFETKFIEQVMKVVSIPVIVSGGSAKPAHIIKILKKTNADAVAIATMLHYKKYSIAQIKKQLADANIPIANH